MVSKSRRKTSRNKKDSKIKEQFKKLFLSSQGLPILLTISIIGILFVLFRMKGIELNYQIVAMNKDIEKISIENKELKAKKASLLGVKSLRKLARKYHFKQPKQSQIIVIR